MPAMVMSHDIDPREALFKALGDLKHYEIFNNQILVAVYQRPEKTKSGIFLTDNHRNEDRYQSKVGLIIKLGDSAFKDDSGTWFKGKNFDVGDWVVYRAGDGWSLELKTSASEPPVLCRLLDDTAIRARIQHPDAVW